YAHPQNAFWKIMCELYGVHGNYAQRSARLMDARIAVWDVLQASVRPGSMDADIQLETARPNDFAGFLEGHAAVRRIAFNGRKAEQMFTRFVELPEHNEISTVSLPSTSPAYASMSFSGKLDAWRDGLAT
ncbi:MAG: DNA-deoxyinosine glycosylase, partial [Pseudomonadota bacterium]